MFCKELELCLNLFIIISLANGNIIHNTKRPKLQNLSHNLRACTAWRVWIAEGRGSGKEEPDGGECAEASVVGRNHARQQTDAKEGEGKVSQSEANPIVLRQIGIRAPQPVRGSGKLVPLGRGKSTECAEA